MFINKIWSWDIYKWKFNADMDLIITYYKTYINTYKYSILKENWLKNDEIEFEKLWYITNI